MSAGDRDAWLRGVPRRFRRAVDAVMRVSFRRCACELIVAGPRPSVCPELLTPELLEFVEPALRAECARRGLGDRAPPSRPPNRLGRAR